MKHDGSTSGRSTERGKIAGGFYSAWSPDLGLHNDSLASLGQRGGVLSRWRATAEEWQRKDGEKVIFRLVKRFNSLHGVITPQKVFE